MVMVMLEEEVEDIMEEVEEVQVKVEEEDLVIVKMLQPFTLLAIKLAQVM